MLGRQEATVIGVDLVSIHGVVMADVALRLSGGGEASARLGAESIPADLRTGERVLATLAANMIVAITRP